MTKLPPEIDEKFKKQLTDHEKNELMFIHTKIMNRYPVGKKELDTYYELKRKYPELVSNEVK